ncbi:hypothetical protein [Taklimakanibacter deserti]|uniref:hypothetical protein n=1 Tax=Taklimakanibacter deserti TaxID=2267839 RepID=UPI0034D415A8
MFQEKGNRLHSRNNEVQSCIAFNRAIATALRRELGSTHQAAKIVMRWTGASERAVKHWLAGTHGPSGEYLVDLLRNSDEVFRVVLELSGRQRKMSHGSLIKLREQLAAALEQIEEE